MAIKWLFASAPEETPSDKLYAVVVAQSRRPTFYADLGVPDSLDGRFDLIALHMFLVLHRLKVDGPATEGLAQSLFDTHFRDLDGCLREMGVGDMGVAPRIKKMVQAFYGRMRAYEEGLAGGEETLAQALRRNLFGTVQVRHAQSTAMASYLRDEVARLAAQTTESITAGRLSFGPPPQPAN